MGKIIGISVIYFIGIILFLGINELSYRRFRVKGEYTRKFAHVTATLATIPFPYIFRSHWYVLILALIFFGVLYFTQQSTHLNSIHGIRRRSIGSYLLPLSIYTTFLVSSTLDSKFLYILPMLILAICDPVAAIVGMKVKKYNRQIKVWGHTLQKTWIGSAGFLVTSFIIAIIALYIHEGFLNLHSVYIAFVVAIVGTLAEMVSWRGSDNITIPLSVLLTLLILMR